MTTEKLSVVTGAFGYTGRYITKQLLSKGTPVKTITGRTDRPNPFGERVGVEPFNFDKPDALTRSLEGADVLYNTYWIRFAKRGFDHDKAVNNTGVLIKAAEDAGVRRLVHIGVTNASVDSPIPYFRGKAQVEELVRSSSLSHAIVKPAFIFADGDILLNNIAWFLRRFPVFGMMGAGDYRVQPIYAEDLAEMVVNIAEQNDNLEIDAIGPDTFTFEEIVRLTAEKLGRKARFVHLPPGLALFFSKLVGYLIGDVVLTRDEIEILMTNLLVTNSPPTGHTRLSDWLDTHAHTLGVSYASELDRHYK